MRRLRVDRNLGTIWEVGWRGGVRRVEVERREEKKV